MSKPRYVYVRTPVFREAYENTYLFAIVDNPEYKDEVHGKGCRERVFTPAEFTEFCKTANLWSITLHLDEQCDLDYFASELENYDIEMFEPHFPDKAGIDLAPLENLKGVRKIYLYELSRIEKLWDATKNINLKLLHILNCNRLRDFSQLENSNIETLNLFGCNGLSSFTSKLCVEDFSFVQRMPHLKSLHFEIVKEKPSEYYLNILAQMKNLEEVMCQESFFTFEQFAWLASKLPDAKGLEPSYYSEFTNTYSIIGYKKPRFLDDIERKEKYEEQYEKLKEKFKSQTTPPL